MLCGRRTDAPEQVGAGCGHPLHTRHQRLLQHLLRQRMRRAAQRNRGVTAGRGICHTGASRQYQGQRAGPESLHQGLCK